jgi:hypothetical protein
MSIPNEVFFHEIVPHLDTPTIYSCMLICPEYYDYLQPYLINRAYTNIEHSLHEIFNEEYDNFMNILKEYGGVISGSFILKCIINEEWNNSDIDIYFNCNNKYDVNKRMSALKSCVFVNANNQYDPFESVPISTAVNFEYNNHKIQHIYIGNIFNPNPKTIQEMVKYIHDIYDFLGKNMYAFDGKHHLKSFHTQDVLSKQTIFTIKDKFGSSVSRCTKYQARGFQFTNMNSISYKHFLRTNGKIFITTSLL